MIQMLTLNTIELKKKMEQYEQELLKKKLCEQLLSVKTDIEEKLKTQVRTRSNKQTTCIKH
jgi:sensor domain CHASE-containing protein